MKPQRLNHVVVALLAISSFGLLACEADPSQGMRLGQDEVIGQPQPIPSDGPIPEPPKNAQSPEIGETCHSNDSSKICLSLRYVTYKNSSGNAVVSEAETLSNLADINDVWSQCGIAFEIGEYLAVDPTDYGLVYNTSSMSSLSTVRGKFEVADKLLVVSTGTWAGTLGSGAANAWTTMPGSSPSGVVLEAPVATYPNIIAHELGHYLNLDHYNSSTDVMSPVIYSNSTQLTDSQCKAARSAAAYYWAAMNR
jgi:hypothetical protein